MLVSIPTLSLDLFCSSNIITSKITPLKGTAPLTPEPKVNPCLLLVPAFKVSIILTPLRYKSDFTSKNVDSKFKFVL